MNARFQNPDAPFGEDYGPMLTGAFAPVFEEEVLENARLVLASTRQEVSDQWGEYTAFRPGDRPAMPVPTDSHVAAGLVAPSPRMTGMAMRLSATG